MKRQGTSRIGNWLGNMSMRHKLMLVSLSVSASAFLLASAVVGVMTWYNAKNTLLDDVTAHVQILAENSAAAVSFQDDADATRLLSSMSWVGHVTFVGIYVRESGLLAAYESSLSGLSTAKGTAAVPLIKDGYMFDDGQLFVGAPVLLNGQTVGWVCARSNMRPIWQALNQLFLTVVGMLVLIVLATLLLTSWFQRFVSVPISRLANSARAIKESGDYSLHLPRETMDEVGELADAMNETLTAATRSEQNYRQIFNGVRDAIFVQDANDGKVVDVNDAMLKMYGCTRQQVIGRTVECLSSGMAPFDPLNAIGKVQEVVQHGARVFEWHARRCDGALFWVEVNLQHTVIDDEDRILGVVRDITERKKSQQLLIQTEKMLSVGGLAAGIAHEINNPLAGIMQSSKVTLDRLTNQEMRANKKAASAVDLEMGKLRAYLDKRQIIRMLNNMYEAGERAAKIVQNMLSFARKSDSQRISVSLAELLDETLALAGTDYNLKKNFDFRQIDIEKDYQSELPRIVCEPTQIQQVLLNLLRNGAEAMHESNASDGASRFRLALYDNPEVQRVCIEVEDNGPGMDVDTRSRIFEPFYTTKPVGQGTGLGLSVSYYIITDEHGGTFDVTSAPGKGTLFTIQLPYGEPENPSGSNE